MLLIYETVSGFQYLYQKLKKNKMADIIEEFNEYRSRMNENFWQTTTKSSKKFALDTNAYAGVALDVKTKELLGIVPTVLRCDDCVKYQKPVIKKVLPKKK
jgi:alkylhydroperoxidase/carboxymuconolactone decarboxylase family protein YurZ